jgi:hypothetical protein
MSRRAFRVLALALPFTAALLPACSSPVEPTDPRPPSPTDGLVQVTATFDGTLAQGGSAVHPFHTMPGPVQVTLTSLEPADGAPPLGLGVGMWDGVSCQLVVVTLTAVPGVDLLATASVDSQVCVRMWDTGTMSAGAALKYRVTATHNEKPSS